VPPSGLGSIRAGFLQPLRRDEAHRRAGDVEIYFIRNKSGRPVEPDASFRVKDRSPELWNAIDGSMRFVDDATVMGDRTRLHLKLAPSGSIAVIFGSGESSSERGSKREAKVTGAIDLPAAQWTIRFQQDRGAPAGVTQPITHTNIRKYTSASPLLPSGLIGPVQIEMQSESTEAR